MSNFYFTFGIDHKYSNIAVRVQAPDSETARQAMMAKFGTDWGFQYTEEQRPGAIDRFGKKVVDIAEIAAPAW